MKTLFTIGAFGIIFNEQGRVLLCHRRDHDLWNLPGGVVEAGESPWDAVTREVAEETGFIVEILKLVDISSKPEKNEIVFSFICKVLGGTMTLNNEADRIEYVSVDALPSNMSAKQIERIKDIVKVPSEIILRTQTGESSIDIIKKRKIYEQ